MLLTKATRIEQLSPGAHGTGVLLFRDDAVVELPNVNECHNLGIELIVLPGANVVFKAIMNQEIKDCGKAVKVEGRTVFVPCPDGFAAIGGSVTPVACEEELPAEEPKAEESLVESEV